MELIRRIFVLLILGFVTGILVASFFDFGWPLAGLFLILTLAFVGLFFIYNKKKFFIVIALVCFGLVLGLARYQFINNNSADLNNLISRPSFAGLIVADPDRRESTTRLVVEENGSLLRKTTWLREVAFLKSSPRTGEKILVITDNFTDYKYGDKIEITGKIKKPENFLTDKNKVFDYKNYLKVRGIEAVSYYPKIKILARDQGSFIKASLFGLKDSFLNNLKLVLPEPSATLAGGLILGDKGGLGTKVENDFRQAGISHIIVLSGYNITVVAENVLKFFSWFSPAFSWLLGLASIFLLVIMAGGEAAAVRSTVMGAIALIARRYGRTYDAGVALVFAGFLMVLWNPRLLVFDLGFQLSFLATLGMIYLSPIVSRFLDKVSLLRKTTWFHEVAFLKSSSDKSPVRSRTSSEHEVRLRTGVLGGLKEIICTTTGAQLAVYPWLLLQAGNASLVGFVANIFILPIVPITMFASFITGLVGFISFYLSLLFSYPTYFLLEYILRGAHLFASLL